MAFRRNVSFKPDHSSSDSENGESSLEEEVKLFVGGVPIGANNKGFLHNEFKPYGELKEIYCHPALPDKTRTWAFVTYFRRSDAEKAIQGLNRKQPFNMKVELSKPKERETEKAVKEYNQKAPPFHMRGEHSKPSNRDLKEKLAVEPARFQKNTLKPAMRQNGTSFSQKGCELKRSAAELYRLQEEPPLDTFVKVIVVHPVRPFEYWVVLSKNYERVFTLSCELASCEDLTDIENPSEGDYCIAKYEDSWYRAKIVSLKQEIVVWYIDFGNTSTVGYKDLRRIPDIGKNLRSQAIFVKMAKGTSEYYKSISEQESLLIKCVERDNNGFIVHVNGEIYEEKDSAPVLIEQLENIHLENGECIITAVSEKEVFVRPVTDEIFNKSKRIEEELIKHCTKSTALHRSPVVGEVLVARYTDDLFYRAEVRVVTLSGVEVKYIDYGNVMKVQTSDLRVLPESLLKVACLTVPVQVETVLNKSINDPDQMIQEYAKEGTVLTLELHCSERGNVSIYAPHLDIEGAIRKKLDLDEECVLTMRRMKVEDWIVGSEVEINVHEVLDFNSINASLVCSPVRQELDNSQKRIAEYCEENGSYVPDERELCLAYIKKCWNRCCLLTKRTKIGEVTLLETRQCYSVQYKDIRKMPEELTRLPVAGAKCVILLKEGLTKRDKYAVMGYLSVNRTLRVIVVSKNKVGYAIKIQEINDLLEED